MNDRMKQTFDQIHAEEELKNRTREFLVHKTQGYTKSRSVSYKYLVSVAVCFLLILAGGYWLYFIPTAAISIDINPSVELGINRFDKVVSIHAYNSDGQELADSLSIRFKDYVDAVNMIIEDKEIAALLLDHEIMTVAVIGPEGGQCKRMLSQIRSCTSGRGETYCYFAHSEEAKKAHELGLSCGKYQAFLELQELDPDITPEEIQGMTMREIRDLIQQLSGGIDSSQGGGNHGYGHHGAGNGYGRGRDSRFSTGL